MTLGEPEFRPGIKVIVEDIMFYVRYYSCTFMGIYTISACELITQVASSLHRKIFVELQFDTHQSCRTTVRDIVQEIVFINHISMYIILFD